MWAKWTDWGGSEVQVLFRRKRSRGEKIKRERTSTCRRRCRRHCRRFECARAGRRCHSRGPRDYRLYQLDTRYSSRVKLRGSDNSCSNLLCIDHSWLGHARRKIGTGISISSFDLGNIVWLFGNGCKTGYCRYRARRRRRKGRSCNLSTGHYPYGRRWSDCLDWCCR